MLSLYLAEPLLLSVNFLSDIPIVRFLWSYFPRPSVCRHHQSSALKSVEGCSSFFHHSTVIYLLGKRAKLSFTEPEARISLAAWIR